MTETTGHAGDPAAGVAATRDGYIALVQRKRLYNGIGLMIFAVLPVSGFWVANERNAGGFATGFAQILDFPAGVLDEAWRKRADLPGLLVKYFPALVETLNIAGVSTLLGFMAGIVLSLLSTRGVALWPRAIPLFRRLMDILRALPEIVVALVLIFMLGGGPLPAMIAIAIHTSGALGKLYSEVNENADLKPIEGLSSVGASWAQKMAPAVIPQVAPNYLSYALLRFEINIRASATLGFVGAGGYWASFDPDDTAIFHDPDFGEVHARVSRSAGVETDPPPDRLPSYVSHSSSRLDIRTDAGRMTMTRAKTEVFRHFFGWELFWFTHRSPFYGKSLSELIALAFSSHRLGPGRSSIAAMWHDFWHNNMWHHEKVARALGETVLMAFLGTVGAAMAALPLAFMAAANFTPFWLVRQFVRRIFDFVRGVDALIFTILLSRAFGPGPLTGSLAILLTDPASFGKLFSEAPENVDNRQIEGVASAGANPVQRYRFGVIPQLTPVLLSQSRYYLESNTRSATIIGASIGGAIGLMLTQAIITQKDWEEVTCYIILMVMAMDTISGWLRRRLIVGKASGQ